MNILLRLSPFVAAAFHAKNAFIMGHPLWVGIFHAVAAATFVTVGTYHFNRKAK